MSGIVLLMGCGCAQLHDNDMYVCVYYMYMNMSVYYVYLVEQLYGLL